MASTTHAKFTLDQWESVEKRFSDIMPRDKYIHMMAVLNSMCELGGNEKGIEEIRLRIKICGDAMYLDLIRPKLVELKMVSKKIPTVNIITTNQSKPTRKTKKRKGRRGRNINPNKLTKEQIIEQNKKRKLGDIIDQTLKTFLNNRMNFDYGFNSEYAEIRLVTLMYCINFAINNECSKEKCYELYIGAKNVLGSVKNMTTISRTALKDLETVNKKLGKYCKFRNKIMFTKYPRLPLFTKYDHIFPSMSVKPYPSQVQLMKDIKENDQLLAFYNAAIGSGKTTFSSALSMYVQTLRTHQKANRKRVTKRLLFVCSVEAVRHSVCLMAYNKNIPFAIGVGVPHKGKHYVKNRNCRTDEDLLLIVADIKSAITLLKKAKSHDVDYIVFLDEPTVGSDQEGHSITDGVNELTMVCPKQLIWASATLPPPDQLTIITDHIKGRYPNLVITTIQSKESVMGCQITSFSGKIITPQTGCQTANELKVVISQLKGKLFLDRLYTAPIVYRLSKLMKEQDIEIIDLEEYFSDINNLSQKEIQNVALSMLEVLVKQSDLVVKSICDQMQQSNGMTFDLDKILTTEAHKFMGQTLITVNDPLSFAQKISQDLLGNCESATRLVKKFDAEMGRYNAMLTKLDMIKNEDTRSKLEDETNLTQRPSINFPKSLQINTIEHLRRFVDDDLRAHLRIDKSLIQEQQNIESFPLKANVPDWVILLLFAGCGIYDPSNSSIDKFYTSTVLNLASNGKLAYMISNSDNISYGANYPFSHVVVTDDATNDHSIGTIFQLIGRVARVGQSWKGDAHTGPRTTERILNYIKGTEGVGISSEARNLVTSFLKIKKRMEVPKDTNRKPISNIVEIICMTDLRTAMGIPEKEVPKFQIKERTSSSYIPPCSRNMSPTNSFGPCQKDSIRGIEKPRSWRVSRTDTQNSRNQNPSESKSELKNYERAKYDFKSTHPDLPSVFPKDRCNRQTNTVRRNENIGTNKMGLNTVKPESNEWQTVERKKYKTDDRIPWARANNSQNRNNRENNYNNRSNNNCNRSNSNYDRSNTNSNFGRSNNGYNRSNYDRSNTNSNFSRSTNFRTNYRPNRGPSRNGSPINNGKTDFRQNTTGRTFNSTSSSTGTRSNGCNDSKRF